MENSKDYEFSFEQDSPMDSYKDDRLKLVEAICDLGNPDEEEDIVDSPPSPVNWIQSFLDPMGNEEENEDIVHNFLSSYEQSESENQAPMKGNMNRLPLKASLVEVQNKFAEIHSIVYIRIPRSREFTREVYRTRYFEYVDLDKYCRFEEFLDWLSRTKTKRLFKLKKIPIVKYTKKLIHDFLTWFMNIHSMNDKIEKLNLTAEEYALQLLSKLESGANIKLSKLALKQKLRIHSNLHGT